MLELENTFAQNIVIALAGTIILGSVVLWKWFPGIRNKASVGPLTSWGNQWLDLFICVWGAFFSIFLFHIIAQALLLPVEDEMLASGDRGLNWGIVAYSVLVQFALLFVILGAKAAFKVRYLPLSQTLWTGHGRAWVLGMDSLIRYLPLIWIASAAWIWALHQFDLSSGIQEAVSLLLNADEWLKFLILVVAAVVVAPIVEELFFRGLVLRFLVDKLRFWQANVITSLIFSALHFNLNSLIPIFLLSLVLGLNYRNSGDIRSAIWMHMGFNAYALSLITIERLSGN